MSVIEILSSKGGAGKTQTSRNLVGMHIINGGSVGIVDADPSRSLTNWVFKTFQDIKVISEKKIQEDEDAKPVHCVGEGFELYSGSNAEEIRTVIQNLDNKHGFVVVDTPGLNADMQQIVASVADLVIFPSNSTEDDFNSAVQGEKLVQKVRGLVSHTILSTAFLNLVNEQSNTVEVVREWFKDAGVNVLKIQMPVYEAFKQCSFNGGIPTKDKPGEKVRDLYSEIIKLISSLDTKDENNG